MRFGAMRARVFFLAIMAALWLVPSASSAQDEMEQQRCVWRCLANSTGNTDPAYHACVESYCTEAALSAPAQPAPPAGSASPGGSPVAPAGSRDRMTVTVVQRALADLGLYYGPVDGVYGGGTASAVETFRESRGLGPGGIDTELVYRLRQESAARP